MHPASYAQEGMPPEELQEVLCKRLFADPTHWWGNRQRKRASRHPDFEHKESKVALWLKHGHKPAWVDSKVATLEAVMKKAPEPSSSVEGQEAYAARKGDLEVGICRRLCEDGRISGAVDALNLLVQRGSHVPNNLFYRVLKRCITQKDLVSGRIIHALTVKSGYEGSAFLATQLIGLYASHHLRSQIW